MSANVTTALFFLVQALFALFLWALLLRLILQIVRADFYNPLSQVIWRVTQPAVRWIQPIVPRWRNFDGATLVVALVVSGIYINIAIAILNEGHRYTLGELLWYTIAYLVVLTLKLYIFTMFVQAVLSWVGPGVSNPAGSVLWSVNEPLLRPIRRVLPPVAGLDFSPIVVMLALQVLSLLIPLGNFR